MLEKGPTERFSATATLYARWRPTYPAALRDFLLALLPTSGARIPAHRSPTIVDVACGTGISTRFLAGPGRRIIGIEPNAEMLAEARRTTPADLDIEYRKGEAATTGLAGGSADLVTVGQAFHWFELGPALAEFHRILQPEAFCAAFWNVRDSRSSLLLAAYQSLLEHSSAEYKGVLRAEEAISNLLAFPAVRAPRQAEFAHVQVLDRDGFFGRVYSSSYVTHGVPAAARPAFDAELDRLFARHAVDGWVELHYRTVVVAFQIGPVP